MTAKKGSKKPSLAPTPPERNKDSALFLFWMCMRTGVFHFMQQSCSHVIAHVPHWVRYRGGRRTLLIGQELAGEKERTIIPGANQQCTLSGKGQWEIPNQSDKHLTERERITVMTPRRREGKSVKKCAQLKTSMSLLSLSPPNMSSLKKRDYAWWVARWGQGSENKFRRM